MAAQRAERRSHAEVIEGVAVVVDRRLLDAAASGRQREPEPTNDNHAAPLVFPVHRRSRPDLLYPGAVRWPAVPKGGTRFFGSAPGAGPLHLGLSALAVLFLVCIGLAWRSVSPPSPVPAVFLGATGSGLTGGGSGAKGARLRPVRPSGSIAATGASTFFPSTLAVPSARSDARAAPSPEGTAKESS